MGNIVSMEKLRVNLKREQKSNSETELYFLSAKNKSISTKSIETKDEKQQKNCTFPLLLRQG